MDGDRTTGNASPGWYPDPTQAHEQRYWDGVAWTEDVADAGQQSRDPIRQAQQNPTPSELSEQEGVLLTHTAIAIAFPPWALIVLLIRLSYKDLRVQPRFRRVLGLELMIGAGLYAFVAVSSLGIGVAARQPSVPPETPSQVLELQEVGSDFKDGLIVYQEQPYKLKVVFDEKDVDPEDLEDPDRSKPILESLGGYWSGTDAQLSAAGHETVQGKAANTRSDWPPTLRDEPEAAFRPEMTAAVPLTEDDIHRELTVRASMVVELPFRAGSGKYDLETTSVSKTAKLFVITPEEKKLRDDKETWRDRSAILVGGVMWLVLAASLGWAGWRQRRKGREAA